MNNRYLEFPRLRSPLLCLTTAVALAGCATPPEHFENDPALMQEALQGTGSQRAPLSEPDQLPPPNGASVKASPRQQIKIGNQTFVRPPPTKSISKATNSPAEDSGAIVFRLIFVAIGTGLLAFGPWVEVLFAVVVAWTAVMMREFSEYRMLLFGALMVLMMIWRPQGLLPMQRPHLELRK